MSAPASDVSLDEIKAALHELDPKLKETDEAWEVGLFLLAGLQVGTSAERVATFTGLPSERVHGWARRARAQRIWRGGKTACEWFDEKSGGVAFWCDVSVVMGFLARSA